MDGEFCWTKTTSKQHADNELQAAYDVVARPDGSVHNMYQAFGSRPDLLVLADRFYRELLHSERRTLEAWVQELIATYVAILNDCAYARDNHGANFKALLSDGTRGERILAALVAGEELVDADDALVAILRYTYELTVAPATIGKKAIDKLRAAGVSDAQIFEINQIASNFAYWTRVLNGLGIRAAGEQVGLYGRNDGAKLS